MHATRARACWRGRRGLSVERLATSGEGTPEIVAGRQQSPRGIATDDQYVYWVETAAGNVRRIAKP